VGGGGPPGDRPDRWVRVCVRASARAEGRLDLPVYRLSPLISSLSGPWNPIIASPTFSRMTGASRSAGLAWHSRIAVADQRWPLCRLGPPYQSPPHPRAALPLPPHPPSTTPSLPSTPPSPHRSPRPVAAVAVCELRGGHRPLQRPPPPRRRRRPPPPGARGGGVLDGCRNTRRASCTHCADHTRFNGVDCAPARMQHPPLLNTPPSSPHANSPHPTGGPRWPPSVRTSCPAPAP